MDSTTVPDSGDLPASATPRPARAPRALRARRAEVARLRAVAVEAAGRGWYVFPLRPAGKLPIWHHRDRCRGRGVCADGHLGWEQRATRDERQIRGWWTGSTPWNVGIACGPSGLLVIDLDLRPGPDRHEAGQRAGRARDGAAELARLAAENHTCLPDTFSVETPSGGRHHYYRPPTGLELPSSQGRLGPGIDTRGRGGAIVAPGSARPDGRYRILDPRPVAELPRWLATLLIPPPPRPVPTRERALSARRTSAYLDTVIAAKTAEVRDAEPGDRQWTLKTAARRLGQLVGGGDLDEHDAYQHLYDAARGHIGVQGMDHREVDTTIRDGMRYGMRAPVRISARTTRQ